MDATTPKRYNAILISGIVIAFLFYPVVGHFVFIGQKPGVGTAFYSRLFIWLEVLVLFAYAKWAEKDKFLWWTEKRHGFWFYAGSLGALILLKIAAGLVSAIPRLFGLHDNQAVVRLTFSILDKSMPLMVFTMITAGITEELIFRGYMLPRLQLVFKNRYMPVIVSSLMFSAMHYRYFSLAELIFAFCIGVIFSVHYQMYRNIKILMVAHAVIDLTAFWAYKLVQQYQLEHHIKLSSLVVCFFKV